MSFIQRIHSPAYYNDFDKDVCAWLRELIKAGLIAPGEVDQRSILDVTADDVRGFTQVHFFAGIGGWSCALRLAGWPDDRPVWTGSPPCQPFSAAGQQKGRDDARHLAPHFVDLVRAGRPGMLFGEQVASADVFGKAPKRARGNAVAPPQWAWLDDLLNRMEAARYAVGASDFPSAGVGAPHIRQRTFFGAVSHEWLADSDGRNASAEGLQCGGEQRQQSQDGGADIRLAHQHQHGRGASAERGIHDAEHHLEPRGGSVGLGNANGARGTAWIPEPPQRHEGQPEVLDNGMRGLSGPDARRSADGGMGNARCAAGERDARGIPAPQAREHGPRIAVDGGLLVGPEHAGPGLGFGQPGPLHGFWRDADWLFCRDGKWRPVEPGTFPLAHGIPGRVGLLRGYGNAINPHAAARFIPSFTEAVGASRQPEPARTDVSLAFADLL